ncbi:MAG: glycosyltransferase [Bacteroidota bacterium]
MILCGLVAMGIFLFWFFHPKHIGHPFLYWVLNVAILYKFLRLLHEWYHYAGVGISATPIQTKSWTVDIFTTFCPGEPYEMIKRTLEAIQAIQYPHETYLCDEGNDPFLKQLCADLGVHHVYRGKDKTGAKAGNINYALKQVAKGEIAVILDPDHVPIPELLDRTLPYFEDPKVGYVQSVQAYRNRNESLIAKGAAEQTYQFYGPLMMSMNTYGTAQAIGANCVFRREALDRIGGHSVGLAEDMHTAMNLHADGWQSVYIPEVLTRGLVPATLAGYYQQQLKWARGVFDLLFYRYPSLFKDFNWRQKLHYFTLPLHYLAGLVTFIDLLVPILALSLAIVPWHVDLIELIVRILPLATIALVIRQFSQRWLLEEHERGFHVLGGTLHSGTWWVYLLGFLYTLLKVKVPYIPTPKDDKPENAFLLSLPNIGMIGLSLAAIIYGLSIDWNPYSWVMAGFAGTNILMLTVVVGMGQQKIIQGIYRKFHHQHKGLRLLRSGWYVLRHKLFYRLLRNSYIIFALLLLTIFGSILMWQHHPQVNLSRLAYSLPDPPSMEPEGWSAASLLSLENGKLLSDSMKHAISTAQEPPILYLLSDSTPVSSAYLEGSYDLYFRRLATQFRNIRRAVWIIPFYSPSSSSEDRIGIWQHVYQIFREEGISHLMWVWPYGKESIPANAYVDRVVDPTQLPPLDRLSMADLQLDSASFSHSPALIETPSPLSFFPMQIKGVNYDPSPQWFRGESPLTRRQIETDFELIRAMGANTIRRYRSDVFDKNILRIAEEKELKVICGFQLDVELAADGHDWSAQRKSILETVKTFRHHRAVLAWNLGNECWSRFRYFFSQPELYEVRTAYLTFIESLAQEIKRLDPHHPVMLSLAGGEDLPSALHAYTHTCPSIDLFGINALYEEQLEKVDSLVHRFAPGKAYLISEFGPDGYWDHRLSQLDSIPFLEESSSYEKAQAYYQRWNQHISAGSGRALGGFAYSWRDVEEGTSTWYGLVDMKGRIRPAYYALAAAWSGEKQDFPLEDAFISPPDPLWYRRPSLVFHAITADIGRADLDFEWYLKPDFPDRPPDSYERVGRGRKVDLPLPTDHRPYRLYLYISDPLGHVVSSSQVINP